MDMSKNNCDSNWPWRKEKEKNKVDGLNETPIFDSYVVTWGSKNKQHMFWTMSSNINNYSTLNNEHNWEDLCIQLRNQQTF